MGTGSEVAPSAVPPARRRFRRLLVTAAVLSTLVLLFYGGGGWYFASQIRSAALLVEDDAPERVIEVAGVGPGRVTFLAGDDPEEDLTSGEVLGVDFANGYGQSGAVLNRTDDRIEKEYRHLSGSPPSAGDLVSFDGYAYPDDLGTALGIPIAAVEYESPFGTFDAWRTEGTDDTWVVLVHGRGAHPREALRALPAISGHPGLIIFYRNDPGQPATDDHLARFGETEWEDLEGAIRYALDQGAADVVILGMSMGGAITVEFIQRSPLAGRVAGVILDAPALDFEEIIDFGAADANVPFLPVRVPGSLGAVAKWIAAARFDIDWEALDYVDETVALEVPILLFHGTEDGTVPISLSDSIAERRTGPLDYHRVEGAGHIRTWNVDPAGYESAIRDFLAVVAR